MAQNVEAKIRITADSDAAESAIGRVRAGLEDVVSGASKQGQKIEAFEAATRDLDALNDRLGEARQRLIYFRDQAGKAGDGGAKVFAADIRATEREIDKLNTGISKQGRLTRAMGEDLAKAGVDTKNLGAEKERLREKSLRAEQGIVKLNGQLQRHREATGQAKEETKHLHQEMDKGDPVRERFIGYAKKAAAAFGLFKLGGLVKESAELSARYETLGVTMNVAGNNAGYTNAELAKITKTLQDQGISMIQSRDAVTQLATANIDLAKATDLGRAAQDLAVVAGENSSEAMNRMIHGIKSANIQVLRTLGLNVSWEDSYKRLAAELGVNVAQLTEQQKVQARTNEVLQQASRYTGIYEESMSTAGKAMGSLTRHWENLKIKLGDAFLPVLAEGVNALTDSLKGANSEMDKLGEAGTTGAIGEGLAKAFRVVAQTVSVLAVEIGYVFGTVGREIGGIAAQIVALTRIGRGGWAEFKEIGRQMREDAEAARAAYEKKIERIMHADKAASTEAKNRQSEGEARRLELAKQAAAEKAAAEAAETADKQRKVLAEDLRKALQATGQDYDALATGIGKGVTDSLGHLRTLEAQQKAVGEAGIDAGVAIRNGIVHALRQVRSESDLAAVVAEMERLGVAGDGAGKAIAEAMRAARARIDDLTPGVQSVEEAYKRLGIQSKETLKGQADSLREAYDMLVRSGVALEDQNAAWVKWAEAAIAANGGMADAAIAAEAAQRGYTLEVDQSGKTVLRLTSLVKDFGAASVEAIGKANAALAEMQATATAIDRATYGGIGTMQSSVDDFHARLQGLGSVVGSHLSAAWAQVHRETNNSTEAIREMQQVIQSNVGYGKTGGIGEYLGFVHENVQRITTAYRESLAARDRWVEALQDGTNSAKALGEAAKFAQVHIRYLSDEDMAPLRRAIADAEDRMLGLRDAARSTLDTIQDEWDQLNNNLDEVEKRRQDKRRAEIEAQLAAAQAAGNKQAVADLQKSLDLLKQIADVRIKDAKAREDEARERAKLTGGAGAGGSGGTATTPKPGSTHVVKINLGGSTATINTASAQDASKLTDWLRGLENSMRSTA